MEWQGIESLGDSKPGRICKSEHHGLSTSTIAEIGNVVCMTSVDAKIGIAVGVADVRRAECGDGGKEEDPPPLML